MPAAAPPRIRQLSEQVANQIAAGEVVERPAAVVKELVENALDAGARQIRVLIEDGGRRLVQVIDDGWGIAADELPLALERHATSKLHDADALERIGTLGFRGEALPSIAAVSELELASRSSGSEAGRLVRVQTGTRRGDQPCAMPTGTRVSVRNLFWNVPARLKFLKAKGTETGHVSDMLTRLALAHPTVGFELTVDGRRSLELPPVDQLLERVRSLLGADCAAAMLAVDAHAEGCQLSGLIAHPSAARPNARRQFVALNGRPLRDKLVIAALREGYRGYLEPRLHPVVVLQLDMEPSLVDVNVHPAKAEVRFRRDREVFALLRRALRDALADSAGGFGLLGGRSTTTAAAQPEPATTAPAPQASIPLVPGASPVAASGHGDARAASGRVHEGDDDTTRYGTDDAPPGLRRVVQLADMYLLLETDAGIRIVDQHALHEKALYLALDPEGDGGLLGERQDLAIPKTIELGAAACAAVEAQADRLAACGIVVERFGPSALALRAMPSALARIDWHAFFEELAREGDDAEAFARLRRRIASQRACRAAVKAGDRLNDAEQHELVRMLYRLDDAEHCPHGRPTTLDLSWGELERRFQR